MSERQMHWANLIGVAQGVSAKREAQISHKPDNSRTDNPEFSVLECDLCVCM